MEKISTIPMRAGFIRENLHETVSASERENYCLNLSRRNALGAFKVSSIARLQNVTCYHELIASHRRPIQTGIWKNVDQLDHSVGITPRCGGVEVGHRPPPADLMLTFPTLPTRCHIDSGQWKRTTVRIVRLCSR